MIETKDSEINVEELMAEIREAVARRELNGPRSLVTASLDLHDLLNAVEGKLDERVELPPLVLQPEFTPNEDDRYHVNDLLQFHDQRFVWNAYRAILKREPDEPGLNQFLENLRSGRYDKLDILASLRYSPEGSARNVTVEGLKPRPFHRRLFRVPIVGPMVEVAVAVASLPRTIQRRRQFEEHVLVQLELMASHINLLSKATFETTKPLPAKMADLSQEQRRFAELQHQQVIGLFREQREILDRVENLRSETKERLSQLANNRSSTNGDQPGLKSQKKNDLDQLLAGFADEFRGTRENIKTELRRYLPVLKQADISDRILDVGCGRGEWLELLRDEGWQARGVENNSVLVDRLRTLELDVMEDDALIHIARLPNESLNTVTAFHFIEHLSFEQLVEFLDQCARVLRPGGLVIFETPNPKNLVVGACNFYSDPTHTRPLFPESLEFILNNRGFTNARIEYVNPTDNTFDGPGTGSQALNSWFCSPRDFAVIATKA